MDENELQESPEVLCVTSLIGVNEACSPEKYPLCLPDRKITDNTALADKASNILTNE